MRVRMFAALRELAGAPELDIHARDVGEVLDQLSEKLGPEFDRIMAAGSVVVDGERASRDRGLRPDDEVALLPPVSGGAVGYLRDPAARPSWIAGREEEGT
jgi:molybdopterin converting factor small subunit